MSSVCSGSFLPGWPASPPAPHPTCWLLKGGRGVPGIMNPNASSQLSATCPERPGKSRWQLAGCVLSAGRPRTGILVPSDRWSWARHLTSPGLSLLIYEARTATSLALSTKCEAPEEQGKGSAR